MNRRKFLKTTMVSGMALTALRFAKINPAKAEGLNYKGRPTPADRAAAAQQLFGNRQGAGLNGVATMDPGGIPDYFGITPNFANSPLPPIVQITGDGVGATAVASVVAGSIASIVLTNPGSGYTTASVAITAYDGSGATASATTAAAGTITGVLLTAGGVGYTAAPTVTFQDVVPGGSGATATATVTNGVVTGITLGNGGSNYTSSASIVISGGNGNGAAALPILNGLTGISVINGGSGYSGMRKFVDGLPLAGSAAPTNLGQYMPIAVPDTSTFADADYYEMAEVEYEEQMHSDLPPTRLMGYVQLATSVVSGSYALTYPDGSPILDRNNAQVYAVDKPHYMGPLMIADMNHPVRIKFTNYLSTGPNFQHFLPVDRSVMGAGDGPDMMPFSDNRTIVHLHGGVTPWISDGTPNQWFTPAGEPTTHPRGEAYANVPDMFFDSTNGYALTFPADPLNPPAGVTNDPGPGSMTYYYTNQQSARLMFYHDHAYGITRLNVYAGYAAGYLVQDPAEQGLVTNGIIPSNEIPLVIQDKTFVPDNNQLAVEDPTWGWGTTAPTAHKGDLWFPHVYMTNQNPGSFDGTNPCGRWDYALWFWPPYTGLIKNDQVPNPLYDPINAPWENQFNPGFPTPSMTMEAFMDTPILNGTAYPYLVVDPTAYRFRILNACDDRSLNLQVYVAKSSAAMWNLDGLNGAPGTLADPWAGEVNMVPAVPGAGLPDYWPTDGRDGGVPDPLASGPSWYQIGTEGGFLPGVAVIPPTPVGYDYNRRSITVLNVLNKCLYLGPAERADVILDFAPFAGKTLLLYNDAPAAMPAFDPRLDYYTGDPDQSENGNMTGGAPTTQPGYGPNIRTMMQIQVRGIPASGTSLSGITVGNSGGGYTTPVTTIGGTGGATADTFGSVDVVTVNTIGAGYTSPVVTFVGDASGAVANASGAVDNITLTNGGTGYTSPVVTISDAVGSGTGATATATTDGAGVITNLTLGLGGSGYVSPVVSITDTSPGTGAGALASATISVIAVEIANGGSGFTTAPAVTITDSGGTPTTPALATATLKVTTITLTNNGSGYTVPPAVTITDNGGTGANATATAILASATAFNLSALEAALPGAYAQVQARPILPNAVYNTAFGENYPVDNYIRIQDTSTTLQNGQIGSVLLTSSGTNYASAPTITIAAPASGTQATATATFAGATVNGILLSAMGSGYTTPPTVGITGGGTPTTTATASAQLTGIVASFTITNGGTGYTSAPTVTIAAPPIGGLRATALATVASGRVTQITLVAPNYGGYGYTSTPSVSFSGGGGRNARATAVLTHGVGNITITNPGAGYTVAPGVTITGGGGTGANATATYLPGYVSGVTLTDPGTGYTAAPAVSFSGGGSPTTPATATATLLVKTLDLYPKAIQELFELDYGRMNATLGVEVPFTNNNNQTTIPYGFVDPPTELFGPSVISTPVGSTGDGTQIWKITHNGVDTHAVHIHLLNWQLINRVGWDGQVKPPEPNEIGWKETIRMNPLEDCIVALRPGLPELPFQLPNSIHSLDISMPDGVTGTQWFNVDPTGQPAAVTNAKVNFGWEYVWHCHLLSHEEMDFMRRMVFMVAPLRPTGLSATLVKSNVMLTWTNDAVNATSFTVQRANAQTGPWTTLAVVPGTIVIGASATYTDTNAKKNTTYFYQVIANNLVGYTQTYAAPTVGYPNQSVNSLPSDGVMINTHTGTATPFIFSSSFMDGLTSWTAVVGNVVVLQSAAMGPSATAGAATIIGPTLALANVMGLNAAEPPLVAYLIDASPDMESSYGASFYFNPNKPNLVDDSSATIFTGLDQAGQPIFGVQYAGDDPNTGQLSAWVMLAGDLVQTNPITLDSTPHRIEVVWNSGDTPNFSLYVDDKLVGTVAGDSNAFLDTVLLGISRGVESGSSAQMYFADFTSNRLGLVSGPSTYHTFLPGIFH